jgi:hypothetical protein
MISYQIRYEYSTDNNIPIFVTHAFQVYVILWEKSSLRLVVFNETTFTQIKSKVKIVVLNNSTLILHSGGCEFKSSVDH